ncbi:MAG: serine/threonine-protein kinase [Polyangiales bacterium]
MVNARPSASNTQQYPTGDSKYPARLAGGVELPLLKPVKGQIGPYELMAELGSGGMGTVYVARRTYEVGVTRTVALKTLRQDLSSEKDLVEMFLDEARITARISHPYVCSVMDIGTHRGVPYVTMDLLIGEPLSRLGPLMADDRSEASLANIVRVIANVCEGLHAAHELRDERGEPMHVVHRDISPDNLFVLYDGSVRVADFGIALTAAQQKDGKSAGLAGKSGYMSPEQLRGLALDRRADLWSMGVVLWELLAGKRLFRPGSDVAATVAILEGPIPLVSRFNHQVPKGLDAVISRALERDRDKRYPTARAMALDLEQVLARCFGPVSAGQVSVWLDETFPNCHEFRRTIVARAEEARAQADKFEFDPNLGILVSTRPPANDQQGSNVRRLDSLATVDVELDEPSPQSVTNEDMIHLDGFAQQRAHSSMPSISERLKFPEPPRRPTLSLASLPSPKRKMVQALIVLGALGLGTGVASLFARKPELVQREEKRIEQPAAKPPEPAPVAVTPQPPVLAQPAPVEPAPVEPAVEQPAPVVAEAPVVAAPVVEAAPAPVEKHHHRRRASEDEDQQPATKLGEVYVFASSGSYEVITRERIVKAPALLKLPVDTTTISVRKEGERAVKLVKVSPQPGRPAMVRIDL